MSKASFYDNRWEGWVLLVVVSLVGCFAQQQPNITFVNAHTAPVYICSITNTGALFSTYKLPMAGQGDNTYTVTPSDQVGKYHAVPADLYPNCGIIYQNQYSTYAVEATGAPFMGMKFISLVIELYPTWGYPMGVQSLSIWENKTVIDGLFCGNGDCGTNGSVEKAIPSVNMECHSVEK